MAWWSPKTWTGVLVTVADLNQQIRDNLTILKTQIADDGKINAGAYETVRGLDMRTHPDPAAGGANSKIVLNHADEVVMNDGIRVQDWNALEVDTALGGAGGIDSGAKVNSTWYEIHAIRKSTDGTKGLLLHRAKDYFLDESQLTTTSTTSLRDTNNTNRRAQGFQVDNAGPLEFIDVALARVGSPTGYVWLEIQSSSAGLPSNTVLATSDKVDVSRLGTSTTAFMRFVFSRSPFTPVAATQYHFVINSDIATSGVNYLSLGSVAVDTYLTRGSLSSYSTISSLWTATSTVDLAFRIYTTRVYDGSTAGVTYGVTMPAGYDQRAMLGFAYVKSSGNLMGFVQINREVMQGEFLLLASGTFAVPTLLDLAASIPPVPVFWPTIITNDTAATDNYAGTVQDAWQGALGIRGTGMVRHRTSAAGLHEAGAIYVRNQSAYVWSSAGAMSVYANGWRF